MVAHLMDQEFQEGLLKCQDMCLEHTLKPLVGIGQEGSHKSHCMDPMAHPNNSWLSLEDPAVYQEMALRVNLMHLVLIGQGPDLLMM